MRYVPERRLALLLALVAPLWLLPGRAGVIASSLALALIVVAALAELLRLPSPSMIALSRRIVVERESALDDGALDTPALSMGIGERVSMAVELRNSSARRLVVTLRDLLPPIVRGDLGVARVDLPARGTATVTHALDGLARGSAPLGEVGIRYTTRLGLVSARHRYTESPVIAVVPSMRGVRRYRLLAMQHHLATLGVRSLRRKGEGQGFAGLREYAVGDDPRHIDWKTSAKKAKLITREFTIERSQTVITLIDAGRGMTAVAGNLSRFEHALDAALVLTDVAAQSGDRVGTLIFDDEIRAFVAPKQSKGALESIRHAVVPVVASSIEPDYASAFRFLATQQRKRALIVFFTDVIDSRASAAMLAYVARSAARHLVVVVALRNDDVFAAAPPADTDTRHTLYAHAAAEELVGAREGALERMRRAGVVVLDISPQTMTAAVVNRYLELKARGAL